MTSLTFSQQIRSHRMSSGRSRIDVATSAKISPTYLGRLETGRSIPPPRLTCERLADALGLESETKFELLRVAAFERGSTDAEESLDSEVRLLLAEIRRNAHAMPTSFVRRLRTVVREVDK